MSISCTLSARAGSLACALLLAAGAARAGSFTVQPTFVQLRPDALTATVDISNFGSQPLIVEVAAYDWSQNDIFVAPPWLPYTHSAAKESVLFSISDRPAPTSPNPED